MRNIFFTAFLLMIMQVSFGQNNNTGNSYYRLLSQAQSFYQNKDYLKSAGTYTEIYNRYNSKMRTNDYYDAACSYALSNLPDSAKRYLKLAVNEKKYINLDHIQSDSDLTILHDQKDWESILAKVKCNKQEAEKAYNRPVVLLLDSIYQFDQDGRKTADDTERRYGYRSAEMKKYLYDLHSRDSINLMKVTHIIDKYGWLGPDRVGEQGNTTLFLVIQHADKDIHKKYLPVMRQAVLKGNAKGTHLALLEDRFALEEGKKQVYGSQIIRDKKTGKATFAPIEDEKNVNARRESVGLGPLEEYAKLFHINYNNPAAQPAP